MKMLLSSFAFLSCLGNQMPKTLTTLCALTIVAMDRADLLIMLGGKSLVVHSSSQKGVPGVFH